MKILKNDTDFFGLDIGTTALRLVQLKNERGTSSLVTYGSVAVEENLAQSDSAEDKRKLGAIVKQLVQSARVSTKNVVVGLPSQKVFSSIVSLPKMDRHELPKAIRHQAEQYIPMSLDEAQFDWTVLDETEQNTNVLLVAANKKAAESLLDTLEAIDLEVKAIEPDAMATTRSLLSATHNGAVAIVDVGAFSADITVVYQHNPWVIRTAPVGGNTLIRAASQNLNIDEEQAAQFVRKFGLTKTKLEGQVFKALKPSMETLTDEISKSIKFFNSRYQNQQLEKIILTGGVTGWPDFPLHIADTLGMPVEIGNAWINVSYPATQQDALMNLSSQFAVATGLALRGEQ